jgi:hypothetical protein
VIAGLFATIASSALAQPKKDTDKEKDSASDARAMAETLFFAGRGLMDAGRYEEACKRFQESYRLDPAAGTLLNLAACHEKIGKIASAWGEFKQSLVEAEKAKREDRVKVASERIAVLEPDLPYLTIQVPAPVPGLEVTRNGELIGPGSYGVELPVDPGMVDVGGRAPGYVSSTTTIKIEKRERKVVSLPPLAKAKVPTPVAPITTSPGFWTSKRLAGVAIIGTGLLTAGVGTWYGLRALDAKEASDRGCPIYDGDRRCDMNGSLAMDRARSLSWHSTMWFGVSIVSVAAGMVLVATGGRAEERRITVSAVAAPGGAAGFIRGEF